MTEVWGCGCDCVCHTDELTGLPDGSPWPGPCAACCEPGDPCDCGFVLAYMDEHADRRDAQRERERRGMQVTNRSIKTVLLPVIAKKAKENRAPE